MELLVPLKVLFSLSAVAEDMLETEGISTVRDKRSGPLPAPRELVGLTGCVCAAPPLLPEALELPLGSRGWCHWVF